MDMLESKLRRVRAMVSGKARSATSNVGTTEPKTRPSVTWADRKEESSSSRPFRRFQQSFRSRDTGSGNRSSLLLSGERQSPKLDNRPSPSKFRRFFQGASPTSTASPSPSSSRNGGGGGGVFGNSLEVPACSESEDNRSSTSYDSQDNVTRTPTVSPNLAAKVLFRRQLSVNFGNDDGDDEMCYGENDFVVECLQWHNVFRDRHSAPHLVLSSQLCESAQAWANTLAHNEMFYHSNPGNSGENLFTRSSCDPEYDVTGRETTVSWYSGIKQYNFNAEPELLHVNAGQFTQMVWRESTQLGVGKARTRGGKVVVVAHYRPQGNVFRRFKENVLPERSPSSSKSSSEGDEDDDEEEEEEEEGEEEEEYDAELQVEDNGNEQENHY